MRRLLLATVLAAAFPSPVEPADGPACPQDTTIAARELAAGHRLYMAAHTTKGWVLMLYGTSSGDHWLVYAINGRHEACVSSEGDHLEIVKG